jgi:gliding motility-associated-like protein
MKTLCFLFSLLFLSILSWGQTVINPGDLVIMGVNAKVVSGQSYDEVSFACFQDITPGTEIQITDNSYERCYAGLWGGGEGGAKLTRFGTTIPAGTVITFRDADTIFPYIHFTYPDTFWSVASLGVQSAAGNVNMNSGGDQIFFAQDGVWVAGVSCSNDYPGTTGRMLFAFSTSGGWVSLGNSTTMSALYPGMSCYNMAPSSASDFIKYTGPLTAALQKDWITRIGNPLNWTNYANTAAYLAASPDLHTTVLPIIPGTDADWSLNSSVDTLCPYSATVDLNSLISGMGMLGGTWSGTGVTGSTFDPAGLNGTYNITYTIDCPCCISQTHPITVTVPTVNLPANFAACNGGTVAASSFTSIPSGGTFAWTNDNTSIGLAASGTGNTTSFTATNSGTTPVSANITVTPTAVGCVGTASTFTITVNPTPTVTVPSNITICNGGTITGTAFSGTVTGTTYDWTNSNTAIGLAASGTGNISGFTATNSGSSPITATITVTPTANSCTGTPATYTITVNPTDDPSFIYSPSTLCQTGTDVSANITGGATGTFSSVPAGLVFLDNSTGLIDLSASAVNTYTITFNTNGTCPSSSIATVTITTAPSATFNYSGPYCANAVDPLPSFGSGASAGVFSANPAGLVFINTSTGLVDLSASIPGTYTVTNSIAAAGGCAAAIATNTITINPTPTVTAPANSSVCSGTIVPLTSLTGSPVGVSFAWTNSNTAIGLAASGTGDIPGFTASNSGTTPITTTITVTPTANSCSGTPASYTITVNPTDDASFNYSPATLCQTGTDVSANITGGATGIFSSSPAGLVFLDNTTGLIDVSSSAINTYTITFNTSGICPSSSTASITVTTAPSANFSYTGPYCQNDADPTPAFGLGASAGTFSAPLGLVFVSTATGVVDLSASTPGTYTVTNDIAAAGGCAAASASNTITINPMPTVSAPSNFAVCNEANVPLTSFSGSPVGVSFSWTNSNTAIGLGASGTGDIPSFTATNTGTTPITSTITVTPTANSCTGTATTFTITVNPTPAVTVPADIEVCAGGSVPATTFSSTVTGTTYDWTNDNTTIGLAAGGSGDIAGFTAVNSGGAPIIATITVTPTANGCPGTPSTYTITVNPNPTATASSNTPCEGETLNLSSSGGSSYNWSGPNGFSNTTQNPAIPSVTLSAAGTYTVTVTNTSTGCSATDDVIVTVNSLPNASAGNDQSICSGQVATLTATGGGTYAWNAVDFTPTINVSPAATTTYVVTVTSTQGCSATDDVTVTVNPLPTADAGDDASVCSGNSTQLTANGGDTYAWAPSAGLDNANINNPVASPTNTTIYFVTITDANGCSDYDSVTVNIFPQPNAFAGNDTSVCESQSVTLSASGGTVYNWSSGETTSSITVSPASTSTYTVTVANSDGCSTTDDVSVSIDPVPVVTLSSDPGNQIYIGQDITITANPSSYSSYYFYNDSTDLYNGPVNFIELNSIIGTDTIFVVASQNGCTSEADSIIIEIKKIPNAFTPLNSDEVNDIFLKGLDINVFNRWGEKIYEGKDGWDGKYNGIYVSKGTYYFTIKLTDVNNNISEIKGSVTVVN